MAKGVLLLVAIAVLSCSVSEKLELPALDPELREELESYLRSHHMTPEEYVLSKFKEQDVVIIGEYHRIKHDVKLIQDLIPLLYENGVFVLGSEFGRQEDQDRIDSLINAPNYDESLARNILFDQFVSWGYQEYLDIYRVAWQLNRSLPENARKFRILGLDCSPDWSFIEKPEDRDDSTVMKKVWKGCGEDDWAQVILGEVVGKGEKALIHCGIHHAFSEYEQPIFNEEKKDFIRFEDRRLGNYIYREIGKRVITIFLHSPWCSSEGYSEPTVYAADGIIDALMAGMEPGCGRVGFDVKGTPFGKLPGETSIYKHGYEDFALEMFCDGYIYQMPLSKYQGVTPIDGFINEKNIEEARLQSSNPGLRDAPVERFNRGIAVDADMTRRFARFH